jgi:hypothetical protein
MYLVKDWDPKYNKELLNSTGRKLTSNLQKAKTLKRSLT